MAPLRDQPVFGADRQASVSMPARRAAEFLAVRVLLRRLLADTIGAAAAISPLAARPGGQPYLVARPEIGVSLSHSKGWVAAAVCPEGSVGVDVQVPIRVANGLIRRCCGGSALSLLPQSARDLEFSWIWSVQEACVKATGAGIAGRPWNVPVNIGQRRGRWGEVTWCALRDEWPVPVSCAQLRSPVAQGRAAGPAT